MNITIGAIETFLPGPSYTTDGLLDASGGKLSPDLQAMLRRLGVEQRHSILSNYPQVLFEGTTPEYSVRGTEMAVRAARGCLAKARCDATELGLVIAATNTPSRLVPGLVSDLFAQMAELK